MARGCGGRSQPMAERAGTAARASVKKRLLSLVRQAPPPPSPDFASALIEHLSDGVVACDADGNFVMLNRRVRDGKEGLPQVALPLNVPIEQWAEQFALYPRDGHELLSTDELPLVLALRGQTVEEMELETHAEDGTRTILSVSGGPVLDADGRQEGAVLVLRDITERAALDRQLRLDGAVAAHLAVGVGMVRASDGEIVYANDPWERLFGYEHGELIGKHISVINAPSGVSPEERAQ